MNVLQGNIATISVQGPLTMVGIMVQQIRMSAIVIDTPHTAPYLREGHAIRVVFKETEVIIGKGNDHTISLQNKLVGKISAIESGALLSKVTVETAVGVVTSVITSSAVRQLQLVIGVEVTAMIKTNEIMLWE